MNARSATRRLNNVFAVCQAEQPVSGVGLSRSLSHTLAEQAGVPLKYMRRALEKTGRQPEQTEAAMSAAQRIMKDRQKKVSSHSASSDGKGSSGSDGKGSSGSDGKGSSGSDGKGSSGGKGKSAGRKGGGKGRRNSKGQSGGKAGGNTHTAKRRL